MKVRQLLLLGLFALLVLFVVPPALAQDIEDINLDDIINALGPRSGEQLIFDIMLYLIFFIAMITLFLIPDKQLAAQVMIFTVLTLAVVSKLLVGDHNSAILQACDLPMLPINATLFVFPLIVTGMLRSVKGKPPKARIPAGMLGLLGGGYFFLFWALEQRTECNNADVVYNIYDTVEFASTYITTML